VSKWVGKIILMLLVLLVLVSQVQAQNLVSVKWYQVETGKEVNFFVPNVNYKAVVTINSDKEQTVTVEIRVDRDNPVDTVLNAFGLYYLTDDLITSKTVTLSAGTNTIEIPFVWFYNTESKNGENPYNGLNGVYIRISGVYDVSSAESRLSSNAQIRLTSHWWAGLRMSVNGVTYENDVYAQVPSGATVKMWGYLYNGAEPAAVYKIKWSFVKAGQYLYSYTDMKGYFEKTTTAPDWSEDLLCGDRGRYYKVIAYDPWDNLVAANEYTATYVCPTQEPTPTPTPELPAAYVDIQQVVGYGVAVGGLIAIAYLLSRRGA